MNNYLKLVGAGTAMLIMSGCIDNNYDISDIDTTVKVNADQLVIPINIDEISMGSIINLHEDDIVKIIDGKYTILREGDFTSENIMVPAITLTAPTIAPTAIPINLTDMPFRVNADDTESLTFTYEISSPPASFSFSSSNVSDLLVSIDRVGCELDLTIAVQLDGLQNFVNHLTLDNVVLQLPKGLEMTETAGGTYNSATGELKIASINVNGTSTTLKLHASGLNMAESGGDYNFDESSISVKGSLYIKSGLANISISDIKQGQTSLPNQVTLRNSYTLSNTQITTFSGKVRYKISKASLTDIDLSQMPEVLAQSSTNLAIVNPQIFLAIDNPLQAYNIYARTGLRVDAFRGEQQHQYMIDNPWFQIGPDDPDGNYYFCLSPFAATDPEFPDAVHVPFSTLGQVLSGNGVPTKLSLSLVDPNIPAQAVTDFRLGQNMGALHGHYKFLAPLDFVAGSTVTYEKTIDGWHSDELDNMTIQQLEITLDIATDIPVNVNFTGYPIDTEGNRIEGVEITGANIVSSVTGQTITIVVNGAIDGHLLDGIRFTAVATAIDGSALSPDMSVRLSKIRPKVTGYYQKKL